LEELSPSLAVVYNPSALSPSSVVVYHPSALSPSYYSLFPSCSLSLVLADRSSPCPVDPFPGNFHKELLYHQEY
jgi:hypothetical protein